MSVFFRFGLLFVLGAFAMCVAGCESKNSVRPAAADDVNAAGENAREPQKLPVLDPPPGDPGPFLIRLDALFPTQVFGAAATETHIAVAMQSDARDVSLCPQTQLPICFRGTAVIVRRRNPNTALRIDLYESDTQSGARIDDVESVGDYFAFAVREGIYAGDIPKQTLAVYRQDGAPAAKIDLTAPQTDCRQIALAASGDRQIIVCAALDLNDLGASHRIACRSIDAATSKSDDLGHISAQAPVRSLDIATGFGRTLAVWTAQAHAYAAFLDAPENIADLGPATAVRPSVACGADRFAVAWQGDDGTSRIDAIFPNENGAPENRRSLILSGAIDRSVAPLAAFSRGYAFAFRHQNTQQIGVADPDLGGWHLVSDSDNWRMFGQYGALDVQNAHNGKLIWQTVESLIQKNAE